MIVEDPSLLASQPLAERSRRQVVALMAYSRKVCSRRPQTDSRSPGSAARRANMQPFLAIETGLLVAHDKSLTAYQHKQAAIAEATANRCKLAQPIPHSLITRSLAR